MLIPKIKIDVKEKSTHWEFSIQDNGIGIEAKYLDRIFKIFQRLDLGTDYNGTGIGLAQCKKVVENHQGEIWCESSVDIGSTFYFTIIKSDNETA